MLINDEYRFRFAFMGFHPIPYISDITLHPFQPPALPGVERVGTPAGGPGRGWGLGNNCISDTQNAANVELARVCSVSRIRDFYKLYKTS